MLASSYPGITVRGCAHLGVGHKDHPRLNLSMWAYRRPGAEGIHGPTAKGIGALEGRTATEGLRDRPQGPRVLGDPRLGRVEELRDSGLGVGGVTGVAIGIGSGGILGKPL